MKRSADEKKCAPDATFIIRYFQRNVNHNPCLFATFCGVLHIPPPGARGGGAYNGICIDGKEKSDGFEYPVA